MDWIGIYSYKVLKFDITKLFTFHSIVIIISSIFCSLLHSIVEIHDPDPRIQQNITFTLQSFPIIKYFISIDIAKTPRRGRLIIAWTIRNPHPDSGVPSGQRANPARPYRLPTTSVNSVVPSSHSHIEIQVWKLPLKM